MQSPFAETRLIANSPIQGRLKFHVSVFAPVAHPDGGFICRVATSGRDRPDDIAGDDALQALLLALCYLGSVFENLIGEGWSFYMEDGDPNPIDPRSVYRLPSLEALPAA